MNVTEFEVSHYNSELDSLESLNEVITNAYQKNFDFFQDVVPVKVHLVYTRGEMDSLLGRKTEDWVVGTFNTKKHAIYVFAPSVYEKESSHRVEDFPYTIAHEMAHIFTAEQYGLKDPKWLNEGLAGYVAQDYEVIKMNKGRICPLRSMHTYKQWDKNHNYPQAFSFTKYLIDRFGKEAFLRFYRKLEDEVGYEEFAEKFQVSFNTSLADCEKDWQSNLD